MPSTVIRRFSRYSARDVFELVLDIDRYSSFVPYCLESSIVEGGDCPDVGRLFAVVRVGFKKLSISYLSEVSYDAQELCVRVVDVRGREPCRDSPFRSMLNLWNITPIDAFSGSGGCEIRFEIDFELRDAALNALASFSFLAIANSVFQAFADRADEVLGGSGDGSAY